MYTYSVILIILYIQYFTNILLSVRFSIITKFIKPTLQNFLKWHKKRKSKRKREIKDKGVFISYFSLLNIQNHDIHLTKRICALFSFFIYSPVYNSSAKCETVAKSSFCFFFIYYFLLLTNLNKASELGITRGLRMHDLTLMNITFLRLFYAYLFILYKLHIVYIKM